MDMVDLLVSKNTFMSLEELSVRFEEDFKDFESKTTLSLEDDSNIFKKFWDWVVGVVNSILDFFKKIFSFLFGSEKSCDAEYAKQEASAKELVEYMPDGTGGTPPNGTDGTGGTPPNGTDGTGGNNNKIPQYMHFHYPTKFVEHLTILLNVHGYSTTLVLNSNYDYNGFMSIINDRFNHIFKIIDNDIVFLKKASEYLHKVIDDFEHKIKSNELNDAMFEFDYYKVIMQEICKITITHYKNMNNIHSEKTITDLFKYLKKNIRDQYYGYGYNHIGTDYDTIEVIDKNVLVDKYVNDRRVLSEKIQKYAEKKHLDPLFSLGNKINSFTAYIEHTEAKDLTSIHTVTKNVVSAMSTFAELHGIITKRIMQYSEAVTKLGLRRYNVLMRGEKNNP